MPKKPQGPKKYGKIKPKYPRLMSKYLPPTKGSEPPTGVNTREKKGPVGKGRLRQKPLPKVGEIGPIVTAGRGLFTVFYE